MCGSLKHSHWSNKSPIIPGSLLPREARLFFGTERVTRRIRWQGFARQETVSKWLDGGWREGTLEIEGYTEKDNDFQSGAIKVICLDRGDVYFNIVTRPSATEEESSIHDRWPVLAKAA